MTQIIYGRHPVLAALRQSESPLEEIIVAQGAKGQWLYEVKRLARAGGVRLRVAERAALDRVCGTPHHQGILARRGSYVYRDLGELLENLAGLKEPALLVAADSLTDPMNLGNLCRSALAAGAHGLIIPKDRAAGVTPVVTKAAAGALEYLAVYRVTNLADCLARLKRRGPGDCRHRCRGLPKYLRYGPDPAPGPGHRQRRQGVAPPGAAAVRPGGVHPHGGAIDRLAERRGLRRRGPVRSPAAAPHGHKVRFKPPPGKPIEAQGYCSPGPPMVREGQRDRFTRAFRGVKGKTPVFHANVPFLKNFLVKLIPKFLIT